MVGLFFYVLVDFSRGGGGLVLVLLLLVLLLLFGSMESAPLDRRTAGVTVSVSAVVCVGGGDGIK